MEEATMPVFDFDKSKCHVLSSAPGLQLHYTPSSSRALGLAVVATSTSSIFPNTIPRSCRVCLSYPRK